MKDFVKKCLNDEYLITGIVFIIVAIILMLLLLLPFGVDAILIFLEVVGWLAGISLFTTGLGLVICRL